MPFYLFIYLLNCNHFPHHVIGEICLPCLVAEKIEEIGRSKILKFIVFSSGCQMGKRKFLRVTDSAGPCSRIRVVKRKFLFSLVPR